MGAGSPWSKVIDARASGSAAKVTIPPADGRGGTADILAQTGHSGSTARLCLDYRGCGFADWYLPSRIELQILAAQAGLIGKLLSLDDNAGSEGLHTAYAAPTFGGYWSSSEFDADCAWAYDFNYSGDLALISIGGQPVTFNFCTGNVIFRAKDRPQRVRAVRRF